MSDFWQFFYGRLAAIKNPIFKFRELEAFPREDWQPLIDSKVLVRSSEPETIIDEKGIELTIRRSDDRIFGVDPSDEVPSIKPLEDADVIHYGISAFTLLKTLRQMNGVKGNDGKEDNGFYYIGITSLPESGDCRVFLVLGCNHTDSLEQRLYALANPTSTALVISPEDIGIHHAGKLPEVGVFTATLEDGFQIRWPQNIHLGQHTQNAISQKLVKSVDQGFKQVGVNISQLEGENDMLKSALADKMAYLAGEVEPEYFTWIMHVIATGSVSGASKVVGIANSTFAERLKAYRARGGVYEILFQLHEARRRTIGTRKLESYNELYEAHQQSEAVTDMDLLRDIFEAFRDQNGDNWEAIRNEMLEVLKEVVP